MCLVRLDLCQLILRLSFLFPSALLLPTFYYSIPTCNFWSAPIHALIIYSKENHRQRYLRKETLMYIYSRTEVGQEMKTFHVVSDRNKHAHDKITLLSLLQILFPRYLELYYDGVNNHNQATQFILLRSFCMGFFSLHHRNHSNNLFLTKQCRQRHITIIVSQKLISVLYNSN